MMLTIKRTLNCCDGGRGMDHGFCCKGTIVHEDAVRRARRAELESSVFEDMTRLYKMMADHSRLRILWALRHGEMCVCDLAALLGVTKSAVSHHMKALRLAMLAGFRREGKMVYYSLRDEHVEALIDVALAHVREGNEKQ